MKSVIVVLLLVFASLSSIGDSLHFDSDSVFSAAAGAACASHDHNSPSCEPSHSDDRPCDTSTCHSHGECFHQCLKSSGSMIPRMVGANGYSPFIDSDYSSPSVDGLIRPPIA